MENSHIHRPDPGSFVIYEMPGLAVNKNGDAVVVYGGIPIVTKKTLPQQSRFSIIRRDSSSAGQSQILKEGDALITFTPNPNIPVPEAAPFHGSQSPNLGYCAASTDPADDLTIWMSCSVARAGSFAQVVGKVTP